MGRLTFHKRSDLLADALKREIALRHFKPGDRLPNEKELTESYGLSKGTVREALKSLEVQGLVKVSTGPKGGATVLEIEQVHAVQLLSSYFFFNAPSARDLYDVRILLEPEVAASAVGHLTETHFEQLEALITAAHSDHFTPAGRLAQRNAELEFHNVIASASPNTLLSFICGFINRSLSEIVVFRRMDEAPHTDFAGSNCRYHQALLDAFRKHDREDVRRLMAEHMREAAAYMARLEVELDHARLLDAPPR